MLYFVVYYPVFKTAKVVIFCKKEGWGIFFLLFDWRKVRKMNDSGGGGAVFTVNTGGILSFWFQRTAPRTSR